jgi:hypothetical protein
MEAMILRVRERPLGSLASRDLGIIFLPITVFPSITSNIIVNTEKTVNAERLATWIRASTSSIPLAPHTTT